LILVKPDELQDYWGLVRPGIEAVRSRSDGWLVEDVYCAVKLGASSLHIGYLDAEYAGFIVLTPQRLHNGLILEIWCCYAEIDGALDAFHEQLEGIGRSIGARAIRFGSWRKGMLKMRRFGYKPTHTVYEKEL
jgi:hypothetical protein